MLRDEWLAMSLAKLFRLFLALLLLTGICFALLQYFDRHFIRVLLYVFFLLGLATFIFMYLLKIVGKLKK